MSYRSFPPHILAWHEPHNFWTDFRGSGHLSRARGSLNYSPHPAEVRRPSLFLSMEFRYWGFYADQDGDPVDLDATMRAHAHVEQHIQRLKDSGLCRFPFNDFDSNQAWLMAVALATDLLRWFQLVWLTGAWINARPKALRWAILHTPGRLVRRARRRIVRIAEGWPTAEMILGAYQRIELII